jgi:peptide/nickel transport system substrate-binding protein
MANEYWSKYWSAKRSRRGVLGAAGALGAGAAGLALVGCGDDDDNTATATSAPSGTTPAAAGSATAAPTAEKPNPGGTVKFPLSGVSSGNPPTLYPFENLTYLAQTPANYYYSRLIRGKTGPDISVDDQTAIEGDLASKWEQVDPLTYVFTFKPNVKWQDKAPMNGRAATAGDWVKTYEAFKKASQNAPGWTAVVDKVEATDDTHLRITLKSAFAPFLVTHASSAEAVWFIPVETIDNEQAKKDPVGTGPFLFEKFESGVSITGKKNPNYFDAPFPYYDRFEASLINDAQRIIAGLQSGDLDGSGLNGVLYKENRSKLDAKGQDTFVANIVEGGLYFNFDNKPWNDARVRQALSMALDRDGYLKVQDGTGKGNWHSFIPVGHAPYYISPRDNNADYGAAGKYWKRNITEAKALLKAATGSDTIKFKLVGSVNVYGPEAQQAWELISASIREAGFDNELSFQEYAQYVQSTFLGKMPENTVALGPLIGSPKDPDDVLMRNYWSKSARHNWGGTPIPEMAELDAMFEKQRTLLDKNERVKYFGDIQRKMSESFLVVPYHGAAGYIYMQPWVKNWWYRAGYASATDSTMKSWFTADRLKKG